MATSKRYTMAEAAQHKTRNDCWIVLSTKVYDVTNFLDEHPGGDEVLLNVVGKDAMPEFDDVGHSNEAWTLLERYHIGEIVESNIAGGRAVSLQPQASDNEKKRKKYAMYAVQFLVPLIVFNIVMAFYSKIRA